ncbi:hypothetical protein ACF1BE_13925 [Streptomyces sp. NPDC014991]|uniref:hypothetical protein n=1 Tax=Streptomyces sp. NPDC014991 TaxID=3364935 RepID=UPI0036F7CF3A
MATGPGAGGPAALVLAPLGVLTTAPPAATGTTAFEGVNRAGPGDNYGDDPVVPPG